MSAFEAKSTSSCVGDVKNLKIVGAAVYQLCTERVVLVVQLEVEAWSLLVYYRDQDVTVSRIPTKSTSGRYSGCRRQEVI